MNLKQLKPLCTLLALCLIVQNIPALAKQSIKNRVGIIYLNPLTARMPSLTNAIKDQLSTKATVISDEEVNASLATLSENPNDYSFNEIKTKAMQDYHSGETNSQAERIFQQKFKNALLYRNGCITDTATSAKNLADASVNLAQIQIGMHQQALAMQSLKLANKFNPKLTLSELLFPESLVKLYSQVLQTKRNLRGNESLPTSININSYPAGAKVYVDGNFVGQTPLQYKPTNSDVQLLTVSNEGYKSSCSLINDLSSVQSANYSLYLPKNYNSVKRGVNLALLPQNSLLISTLAAKLRADYLVFVKTYPGAKRGSHLTTYQSYNVATPYLGPIHTATDSNNDLATAQEIKGQLFPQIELAKNSRFHQKESATTAEPKIKSAGSSKAALWIVGGILLIGGAAGAGIGMGMGGGGGGGSTSGTSTISVSSPQPQ